MANSPLMGSDGGAASSSTMASLMGLVHSAKEKWDASGANEAVGRVSASIPDSTKTYLTSVFRRDQLRSISLYFGLGEERAYYVEKNPALLLERLRHNISFFYLNYLLLTFCLFCLTTLLSPITMLGAGVLGLVWMWMLRSSAATGSLQIGSVQVPQKTAALGLAVVSAFVLMWLFKGVFWWTLFSSGFLVAVHAFLRDASMHKDMDDLVVMEGDLHMGEDSAFLNHSVPQTVHAV